MSFLYLPTMVCINGATGTLGHTRNKAEMKGLLFICCMLTFSFPVEQRYSCCSSINTCMHGAWCAAESPES